MELLSQFDDKTTSEVPILGNQMLNSTLTKLAATTTAAITSANTKLASNVFANF